jgi:hypothetical protein
MPAVEASHLSPLAGLAAIPSVAKLQTAVAATVDRTSRRDSAILASTFVNIPNLNS